MACKEILSVPNGVESQIEAISLRSERRRGTIPQLLLQTRRLRFGHLVALAALSASFGSGPVRADKEGILTRSEDVKVIAAMEQEKRVAGACESTNGVPDLDANNVGFLAENGVTIKPLPVLGAEVSGLDLRVVSKNDQRLPILQKEMSRRGYLVFRGQGVLTGDEQV